MNVVIKPLECRYKVACTLLTLCLHSALTLCLTPSRPRKMARTPYEGSSLERPREAVCDRFLYATFKTSRLPNFFFSYAPSRDAIPSRRGQPCVKRMVVVSFEEHDLHMLAASWPAGFAVLRVGGCHIRSGWEWSRCLGAEPEGHLDATARCRR